MVKKYCKNTVVIEAFQYDGDLVDRFGKPTAPLWAMEAFDQGVLYIKDDGELFVKTLNEDLHVSVGDYIINSVTGELYPCNQDIFEMTYRVTIPASKGSWVKGFCSNCGSPIPTDSKVDFIAESENKFCYYCGAEMSTR